MQPTDNISFTYEQVQALGEKVKSGSPLQGYWGDLTYYSEWIIGWSTESANECTINSVDGNKLDAFVAEYGREGESNQVDFDYESGNWQFWGEEERIEIPTAEMLSRTGIDVAVNEGADWAYMNLRKKVTVNTESETVTKTLKTKAEFYSLCSTGIPGYFATIDGQQIPNQAFKNFLVNSTPKNPDLTYIPHFFLDSSENLESVNIYQTILSVGNNFCSACTKLVSLSISGNITVGNQFCHSCSSLTSASNVRCTKVGNGFFAYTGVTYLGDTSIIEEVGSGFFSHTPQLQATNISFPVLTKMGDQFLADSGVGNNGSLTFNFPILGNIPDFFLADCTNFVLLTLNAPLLKSIGAYFCSGCSALQGILAFPSSVTSVGRGFFYNDTSLYFMSTTLKDNVNVITEFQNLETFGADFLYNCQSLFYIARGIFLPNLKYSTDIRGTYSFNGFLYNTTVNISGGDTNARRVYLGGVTFFERNDYTLSRESDTSPSFILYDLTEGQYIIDWNIPDRTSTPFRGVTKGGQYVYPITTAFVVSNNSVCVQDYVQTPTGIAGSSYVANIPWGFKAYGDKKTPTKGDLVTDGSSNIVSFTGFNADGTWNGYLVSSNQIYQPMTPDEGTTPVPYQSGQNWILTNVQNYYTNYLLIFPGVTKLIANGKVYQVIGKNYTVGSTETNKTVTLRLILG